MYKVFHKTLPMTVYDAIYICYDSIDAIYAKSFKLSNKTK